MNDTTSTPILRGCADIARALAQRFDEAAAGDMPLSDLLPLVVMATENLVMLVRNVHRREQRPDPRRPRLRLVTTDERTRR